MSTCRYLLHQRTVAHATEQYIASTIQYSSIIVAEWVKPENHLMEYYEDAANITAQRQRAGTNDQTKGRSVQNTYTVEKPPPLRFYRRFLLLLRSPSLTVRGGLQARRGDCCHGTPIPRDRLHRNAACLLRRQGPPALPELTARLNSRAGARCGDPRSQETTQKVTIISRGKSRKRTGNNQIKTKTETKHDDEFKPQKRP